MEIIRKEFRQAFREPRMRTMLFLPPIIQLLIFGYAVNLDVDHANMAWMDQDHTPREPGATGGFSGLTRFDILATPASDREVQSCWTRTKWTWWCASCRVSSGILSAAGPPRFRS